MGQFVHAFIEHRMTAEDILQFPKLLLNSIDTDISGQWKWTIQNLNKQILTNVWSRSSDHFIKISWNVEDLILLEKDAMTFHFYKPNLVTFDNSTRWDNYNNDENITLEFNQLTKRISSLLNATDVLIVPDLSSVDIFDEEELSVNNYRLKAKCNRMYAIELD